MFKEVVLNQGSQEWLNWRQRHITASDVPCLFDESPYKTIKELFEEKIGIGQEKPKNDFLMQKGHKVEKISRDWLSIAYGDRFIPAVVESLSLPELGASLDGLSPSLRLIAEFKYIGKKALEDVRKGKLKKHHEIQIQAQLAATGFEKCVYFATDLNESAYIEIESDEELIEEIFVKCEKFMKEVKEFL